MRKIINFTDINPISSSEILKIKKKISLIINKGNFILGNEVKIFEKNFSRLSKTKFSVGCASGTDALTLSLMSLNLKKNDEVIVPGLTYISTGLAVILSNCKLVVADIDKNTGLIDIEKIRSKITYKTKVIIPVNLYGQKVDLKKLRKKIGNKINLIEDSAQSHFAYDGSEKTIKSKNLVKASCYSFYPAKNLGAFGDGGIITTNSKSIYKKLLALRNLGSTIKNKHQIIGLNSRLDTIQAVVLNNKLKTIFKLNEKRRIVGNYYDKLLKEIKEVKITTTNNGSTRHLYVIRVKNRKKLINYMKNKKILCQMHYPYSLNKLSIFKKWIKKTKLKNAESWANECLSLPIHPNLSMKEVRRVVGEIRTFYKR